MQAAILSGKNNGVSMPKKRSFVCFSQSVGGSAWT